MADISISMVLDDRQFTDRLKNINSLVDDFGKKTTKAFTDAAKQLTDLIDKLQAVSAQFNNLNSQINKTNEQTGKLNTGISDLGKTFQNLGTAIIGASLSSFVAGAIETASTTSRMAEALGITTQQFLQMSAGAVAAGKDQDSLGRAMLRMEATAGQAAQGNERLRWAYGQLGVSMEDLQKLSPDQAFLKIARSLASLNDPAQKAELTMMLLGRDAKTIDWASFVKGATDSARASEAQARAVNDASLAYRNIQEGIRQLKMNILELIDPLLKFIGDNASGLIGSRVAAEALLAILAVTTISATAKAFTLLADAVGALGLSLAGTASIFTATGWSKFTGWLVSTAAGLSATIARLEALGTIAGTVGGVFVGIALPFETVGAIILGLATAIAAVGVALYKAFGSEILSAMGRFFRSFSEGISNLVSDIYDRFGRATDYMANKMRALAGLNPLDTGGAGRGKQGGPTAEQAASTQTGTVGTILNPALIQAAQLQGQLDLMNQTNARIRERIRLETTLAGASDVERQKQLAAFDEDTKYNNERTNILNKLKVLGLEATQRPEGGTHALEISALEKELVLLNQQHGAIGGLVEARTRAQNAAAMEVSYQNIHSKVLENVLGIQVEIDNLAMGADARRLDAVQKEITKQTELIEKKRQAELGVASLPDQERLNIEQRVQKEYEKQIEAVKKLNNDIRLQENLMFVQQERVKASQEVLKLEDDIRHITDTADEKRISSLKLQNQLVAEQEIAKRNSLLGPGKTIGLDEQAQIRKDVEDANKGVMTATQNTISASRDFASAWDKSFKQYADDALNGAKIADKVFGDFTKNLEDVFVNFAKTGKLSFSSLIDNMIEDFIRFEVRAMASNVWSMFGGTGGAVSGGGILKGLGKLFGFAEGGNVVGGQPILVGEKGPEVFTPPSGGSITPNNQLGGEGVTNHYHSYNIQAVDAKSVAQLFAENRMTMFGMVEQARRELPMRTR